MAITARLAHSGPSLLVDIFLELMCLCGLLSVFTNGWYKWTFCVRYCKATPLSIQIKLCPHNYRTWQLLSQSFEERAFTQILRFLLFGWRNSINKIFQTKNDNPGFQILYSLSHTHINTHTHTHTRKTNSPSEPLSITWSIYSYTLKQQSAIHWTEDPFTVLRILGNPKSFGLCGLYL